MTENPYQSPRTVALTESVPFLKDFRLLRLARMLALGVVGFATFHLVAWSVDNQVPWYAGLFFGTLFMCSEMLDVPGYQRSVILRLGCTFAVFVGTAMVSAILSFQLGFSKGITYTSDPWANVRAALFLGAFVPSMFLARWLFAQRRAIEIAGKTAASPNAADCPRPPAYPPQP